MVVSGIRLHSRLHDLDSEFGFLTYYPVARKEFSANMAHLSAVSSVKKAMSKAKVKSLIKGLHARSLKKGLHARIFDVKTAGFN